MFSKPLKALPPSTPALAREAQMLPDTKETSNQILVKKLLVTTKSQDGPAVYWLVWTKSYKTNTSIIILNYE